YDEYETLLKNALNKPGDRTIDYVRLEDYAEYAAKTTKRFGKERIAVIYAQGEILYGEGNDEFIGQGIIKKALKKARENSKVKAIVLRVNSPGGSALASELIWREIELTKAVKPVIVSMGNLAASGGYYIACGAEKIFADPTTITGSIGVFGTLPNFKGLTDKIGISAEQVTTNRQSMGYSVFEPMSEEFRDFATESVTHIYDMFLERVAKGRNMTVEAVHAIAQGRVWSGARAQELGLVDEIGGLDDAIAYAAALSDLETYRITSYPIYETNVEEVFETVLGIPMLKSSKELMENEIGSEAYGILKKVQYVMQQRGIQARLPFELNIK
ncbi:MAG: signal peptide peptidase SppA, partial [Bacteroidota bacterium]